MKIINLVAYIWPTNTMGWCRSWDADSRLSGGRKILRLYGTRRFIIAFTRARIWSLSWARWIQSTLSCTVPLKSILIFSLHQRLGLPRGLFPSDFPTKILYVLPICLIDATCSIHLILRGLIMIFSLLLFPLSYVQIFSSAFHPSYCPMGTVGSLPEVKATGSWNWPLTSI
jgi:hypothetical protein